MIYLAQLVVSTHEPARDATSAGVASPRWNVPEVLHEVTAASDPGGDQGRQAGDEVTAR